MGVKHVCGCGCVGMVVCVSVRVYVCVGGWIAYVGGWLGVCGVCGMCCVVLCCVCVVSVACVVLCCVCVCVCVRERGLVDAGMN